MLQLSDLSDFSRIHVRPSKCPPLSVQLANVQPSVEPPLQGHPQHLNVELLVSSTPIHFRKNALKSAEIDLCT